MSEQNVTATDNGLSDTGHRARLRAFLETPRVTNAILAIIIVNAVTLGMSTSGLLNDRIGGLLSVLDDVVQLPSKL